MVFNLSYLVYHVEFLKDLFSAQYYFLLYINDFHKCSKLFDFHLFADDANLFYENKNISVLETTVNAELNRVYDWLCANKLPWIFKNQIMWFFIHHKEIFETLI